MEPGEKIGSISGDQMAKKQILANSPYSSRVDSFAGKSEERRPGVRSWKQEICHLINPRIGGSLLRQNQRKWEEMEMHKFGSVLWKGYRRPLRTTSERRLR